MKNTWIIAKNEVRSMMKERVLVLILILEFILLTSSSMMATGYDVMTSPSQSRVGGYLSGYTFVGIVTNTRADLVSAAARSGVRYFIYGSVQEAVQHLEEGSLDAVVVGSVIDEKAPNFFTVYLPENSPKIGLTQLSIRRMFARLEDNVRRRHIREDDIKVDLVSYDIQASRRPMLYEIYLVFTLPLLVFMPALISGNLLMDSLTQDMESRELLNLVSAPVRKLEVIAGKAFASFAVGIGQMLLWITVLDTFMLDITSNIQIILLGGLYTLGYIAFGAFFSLIYRKMRPTQSLYTLLILSSMIFMTPVMSNHPRLVPFSPAYVISHVAIGESMGGFLPQIGVALLIVAGAWMLVYAVRARLSID